MPALTITFTDDEHRWITEAARAENRSLRSYVHDAAVTASSEHHAAVVEMSRHIATWSADLNERLE